MYPNLFGIEGFSYTLMLIIGVVFSIVVVALYLRKTKFNLLDLIICALAAVFFGIIFAILFENLYEAIQHAYYGQPQKWTWGMTFFGGLFGGVIAFFVTYRFYYRKHNSSILKEILIISPGAITLAHGFGRLGCFLAGCCYGKETDIGGIIFPGMSVAVLPTQLYEMGFLFILSVLLIIFAFKKTTMYTMPIYMICYSIFRFIIEFFRGDQRGQIPGLSPSQYWCIVILLAGIVLIWLYKKYLFKRGDSNEI